jgi:hypothetical protein
MRFAELRAVGLVLCAVGSACHGGSGNGSPDAASVTDGPVVAACADAARDPACDDPALSARFQACRVSADEAGCTAAGGRWAPGMDAGWARCFCPTGQESCPCCRAGDCLGLCYDPTWPRVRDCTTVRSWVCSAEYPVLQCHCLLGDGGEIGTICMD